MFEKLPQFKLLHAFLALLFVFLLYAFIFQKNGLVELLTLRSQLRAQESANAALNQKNQILEKQIVLMQASNAPVENAARTELGMLKKGEVFYQAVH